MPRYIANPTPEQTLAALLASSGASSLIDVRLARWLDMNDSLGFMRYCFFLPTAESMQRPPPQPERSITAEEIVAQHQKERAQRQSNKRSRAGSPSSAPAPGGGGRNAASATNTPTGGTDGKEVLPSDETVQLGNVGTTPQLPSPTTGDNDGIEGVDTADDLSNLNTSNVHELDSGVDLNLVGRSTLDNESGDEGGSGSGSDSEEGYISASSSGSIRDHRSASKVRRDILNEAHGISDSKARRRQEQNSTSPSESPPPEETSISPPQNAEANQYAKTQSQSQTNGPTEATTKAAIQDRDAPSRTPHWMKPELHENIIYLAGNSLGLQSRGSFRLVSEELNMWQSKAVTGWFNSHFERPWKAYAEDLRPMMAGLVGANTEEVAIMGTLTVNMHLLLCSFYRPTKERYKILFEAKAFPSDNYAFASQAEMHGFDRKDALVRVAPREGEYCLRIEDILSAIEREGDQVAVVFFSGVNYFTGQVFDMQRITEAAHKKGCLVGWDLAHAAGNIPMDLHKWNVDFAAWCTYKYLNSGPGGIGALFVHEKHSARPRLAGWWGNNLNTRFQMAEDFDPAPGAAGFQASTPSILNCAALLGSLGDFIDCGKEESAQQETPASTRVALARLRKKSLILTAYLNALLKASRSYVPLNKIAEYEAKIGDTYKDPEAKQFKPGFTIITPEKAEERGCQLSVLLLPRNIGMLKYTNRNLEEAGVFGDEREPDVIRFSPVPMYNSFKECFMAAKTFDWALETAAMQIQGKPRKKATAKTGGKGMSNSRKK